MNEETKLNLALTVAQVNVILGAIAKLPLESVLDTFNTIQQQASAQLNQPQPQEVPELAVEE